MDYTEHQFDELITRVEREGGVHLDELCGVREYTLTGPVGTDEDEQRTLMLPGCGNYSLFEIPYEDESGDVHPIELCAVCDDLGAMPRFEVTRA